MRRGVGIRLSIFLVAVLVSIIYLMPTFISKLPSWWTSFLPDQKIHLGLDLQGGTHLILDVKVEKAVENNLERLKGEITNLLRERGIAGASVERVQSTELQIKVPSDRAEAVRGILKGDFANLTVLKTETNAGSTNFF